MYKKNEAKWMKHYDFILIDIISCLLSFVVAYSLGMKGDNILNDSVYRVTLFILLFIDLSVIFFSEPFSGVLKRGYIKELRISILHVLGVIAILSTYMFIVKEGASHSRFLIANFSIIYTVIQYIFVELRKLQLRSISKSNIIKGHISLIVLLEHKMLKEATKVLLEKNYDNYNIVGLCVLDKDMCGETVGNFNVVANKENILDFTCREWVDEVLILAKNPYPYQDLIDGFSEMGVTQHIKIGVSDILTSNVNIVEKIGPYTCLTSATKTANNTQIFLKRCMDIAGGLVGCLVTLILMCIFYPIVQKKSPGPLIYLSERIGKNGKRFKFYKFRSMVLNADDLKKDLMKDNFMSDGMMFKVKNDPRIIPGYGEFIRKTSLDEFPQFWNVLKGDMSLVGTRPPTPDEWEKYKYHHRVRLSAKPGITGMWQASGRSEITDFDEVVKLDSYYVRNWSLSLDIKLLFKTVLSVLGRKGSL